MVVFPISFNAQRPTLQFKPIEATLDSGRQEGVREVLGQDVAREVLGKLEWL
jgi:hypothetical protein